MEACSAGRAAGGAVLFDLTTTTSILYKTKKSSRDRDKNRD